MIKEKELLRLVIIIVANVTRWLLFDNIILLSQLRTNVTFLHAIFSIFIAFIMTMLTFLDTKEGEGGDGESAQQQQSQQQAQSQTTALAGATISTKKGCEKNEKLHYDAFDTFINATFSTINFGILMAFLSIVFIISNCIDNYGAVLTSVASASLTLIIHTTISGSRELDTIVAVAGRIFTLLSIAWCGGGNNRTAYEIDRSARPGGNKKATIIIE